MNLDILKKRFEKNMNRHSEIVWRDILKIIEENKEILDAIEFMEETEGEPDILQIGDKVVFADFSKESPKRRSLCYDKEARVNRKKIPPESSACEIAKKFGARLMSEEEYMALQKLGDFDLKTSSWLHTPKDVRNRGGAIFGDKRYNRTFIYHNGADSYYASRGFRMIVDIIS